MPGGREKGHRAGRRPGMSRYYPYNGFDAERVAVQAFAWSAPMRDLAPRIGMSDVALRKHLNRLGIVTPPQGHWNRIAAGKPGAALPKTPARRPGETARVRLDERFRDHVPAAPDWPTYGPFASAAVPEDLEELRRQQLKAIGSVRAPRDLSRPAAGLAALLRREEEIRRKAAADRWAWRTPNFDSPLARRKLRILSALLNALARLGHEGDAHERDGELHASCRIGDTHLGLEFHIVGKHRTEMRRGYRRPAEDLPASTPLRLSLTRMSSTDVPPGWEDGSDGQLESRLAEITADLVVMGEAQFRERLVEIAAERERGRQRRAEERLRHIASLEAKRIEDLEASGALLQKAGELRALVARVKAAALSGQVDVDPSSLERWEHWALAQADRIDPVLSGQILSHLVVPELDGAVDPEVAS